jgi:nitroimidazol reductase NimA-like FMN-containing flavoprotein (pyridoxamine 5'-phosphate oxidase superfamily)
VPKRDIRMSDAEIAAFLSRHTGCVFGYNDGGLAPAVLSGTYTLADGVLRVSAERPGTAAGALRADPRIYLIVEQSPSYYEIGYVGIEGSAERIQETAGRLAFDLTPRAVTSASFAKLAEPAG